MVKRGLRAGCPGAIITPLSRGSVWGAVELARSLTPSSPALTHGEGATGIAADVAIPSLEQLVASPTEQRNKRSLKLDTMPLSEAVEMMLDEDARVPRALLAERTDIVWIVKRIIAAFTNEARKVQPSVTMYPAMPKPSPATTMTRDHRLLRKR